jgi:hypothetical protein
MIHRKGLVGYFDILGYQSFLDNNDASDEAVAKTLKAFKELPKSVSELARATVKNDHRWNAIITGTETLIFSDTILLTSAYAAEEDLETKEVRWLLFVYQCAIFQRTMFDFGLPVRGAISFGSYVVEDACFAGKPIVEAYRLTSKIDAALACFSKSATKEFEEVHKGEKVRTAFAGFACDYLVPLKTGEPARMAVINFAKPNGAQFQSLAGEERQLVSECFWKHRKDIPPSAYAKLTHTEMALRYLKGV